MDAVSEQIDANKLEVMAKERPDECFLKGSGILKLIGAIRQLEREVRTFHAANLVKPADHIGDDNKMVCPVCDGQEVLAFADGLACPACVLDVAQPAQAPAPAVPVALCDALRRSKANTDYHGMIAFTPEQLEHFVSLIVAPAAHPTSPESEAEHFIQEAIDRAPEPLRRLGEYLGSVLHEDEWKTAERMLLGAIAISTTTNAGAQTSDFEAKLWDTGDEIARQYLQGLNCGSLSRTAMLEGLVMQLIGEKAVLQRDRPTAQGEDTQEGDVA